MRSTALGRAAIAAVAITFATSLSAQQRMAAATPQNRIALEQYLDWEEVQAPAALARRHADPLHRRWVDKMNDKWESSIWMMNADGTHQRVARRRAPTCTGRPTASASRTSRKGEPSGSADLRALDGRRRRVDADLASHRSAVEPRVVARRQVDRVHDERAGAATTGASRCRRRPRARSGPSRRRS